MERETISTDNQPKGSARNVSDTLDREHEDVAPGERALAEDGNTQADDKSPLEDPGAPGGTSGTGGTIHDQDR